MQQLHTTFNNIFYLINNLTVTFNVNFIFTFSIQNHFIHQNNRKFQKQQHHGIFGVQHRKTLSQESLHFARFINHNALCQHFLQVQQQHFFIKPSSQNQQEQPEPSSRVSITHERWPAAFSILQNFIIIQNNF